MSTPEQSVTGVPLRDFEDQESVRNGVYNEIQSAFSNVFPQTYGGVRLELNDLDWADPEIRSLADQRKAMDQQTFLARRLQGNFQLYDDATGELLDEQRKTVIRAPMVTQRGSVIHNGNEYTVATQARLLPGAYARKKENGEVEVQVNPRQGTGPAFRVHLEPETGLLKLDMRKSSIRLYPLLKDLGYSDEALGKRWGEALLKINKEGYSPKVFDRAYERLVKKKPQEAGREEKVEALKEIFNGLQLHRDTARVTLPSAAERAVERVVKKETPSGFKDYGASESDVPLGMEGLLDITDKVIRVSRGEDDPDERDNLAFKRFYPLDALLKERILLDSGKLRLNTMRRLARMRKLDAIRTHHFDPYVQQLVTRSSLSSPLEEINPLHLLEQQRRFTAMGEGGIQSESAITQEAQNVMPGQFGFIDEFAGPESSRAGIDGRFATGTRLGADGRVYQRFLNRRTGAHEYLSPSDLLDKVLALPD